MEQPCEIPSVHRHRPAFSAAHPCQASTLQAHSLQLRRPQRLQSAWKLQATCAIVIGMGHYMLRARGHQIAPNLAVRCKGMNACTARRVCGIRQACVRYNRRSCGRDYLQKVGSVNIQVPQILQARESAAQLRKGAVQ